MTRSYGEVYEDTWWGSRAGGFGDIYIVESSQGYWNYQESYWNEETNTFNEI
jgi:hypothetical protein